MGLTDTTCKNAKAKSKPYKLSDAAGLYLEVMPNGSKHWRLKYRFEKKEKRLALESYPLVSLAEARDACRPAKKLLLQNIDPSTAKKAEKKSNVRNSKNTFKAVALEWLHNNQEQWSTHYYDVVKNRLEKDLFPYIDEDQIDKIEPSDLLEVLKKIEKRGAYYLARRARQICGHVFRYGIQTGKCNRNPANDLQGALKSRKVQHFNSIETREIPEFLSALSENKARLFARTVRAIKLSMLFFVRPNELRLAQWDEFDLDKMEWLIPASRMKMRKDHIVPLSKQAIKLLEEQRQETGHLKTPYVFPSQIAPLKPMSSGTVLVAVQSLGFKNRMTAHGFRALARSAIREELDYEADVIEVQLAHKPSGSLGAAYDRAKFIKQRHKMMQAWADYLDTTKQSK